jgi:hypothetical protein
MKTPALLKHPAIRDPILVALKGLRFAADLKVLFRSVPHHTIDEQNAIRGLATLHPAIPRKVARLRAKLVGDVPASNAHATGAAGFLFSGEEIHRCVEQLNRDGVYVFKERLPQSLVAGLQSSLKALPAFLRTEDGREVPFRLDVDKSGLFDIREQDLMSRHAVQEYATDPTWHVIAEKYFGAPSVQDETVAWWTFPQPAEFASLNAQMFHSDRRRLSFLKFFIYLTDVTTRNGPHVVVPGSHRTRRFGLRPDRRYADAEVIAGCESAPLEVFGEAGTVIAVDTQALHKGKMLEEGHRLILEIQFATDLLGPPSVELHNDWSALAQARIRANARVFQRFQ